jgi:hypothetical protein
MIGCTWTSRSVSTLSAIELIILTRCVHVYICDISSSRHESTVDTGASSPNEMDQTRVIRLSYTPPFDMLIIRPLYSHVHSVTRYVCVCAMVFYTVGLYTSGCDFRLWSFGVHLPTIRARGPPDALGDNVSHSGTCILQVDALLLECCHVHLSILTADMCA